MSDKLTIKHNVFGDDSLIDGEGNEIELERKPFDDPHFEVDGKKLYVNEDNDTLEERTPFGGDTYEKHERSIGSDTYEKTGCFITTACTMAMGLPDDCEELTLLRKFRREHLEGTSLGEAILWEYKAVSEKILSWIERQDNRINLYSDLYQRLVCGSIKLIKSGKVDEAIEHYKAIVREYEKIAD